MYDFEKKYEREAKLRLVLMKARSAYEVCPKISLRLLGLLRGKLRFGYSPMTDKRIGPFD